MGTTGRIHPLSRPPVDAAGPRGCQIGIWIPLIVALHVALAVPGLSASVWLDEAVTIQLCRLPLSIDTTAANDATPPVYYLLVHAWGAMFGCEVVGLRILSLALSALAAILLLRIGSTWLDLQTGVVAAILFSVSSLQLRYATEARCYTLVEVLLLVSYGSFLALCGRGGRRAALGLALANAAVVQTHYVAALGLLPQLADVVLFRLRDRELRRRYVRSQVLAVALCLPWAVYALLHWPPITPAWLSAPDAATVGYNFRLLLGTALEPGWYALAGVALLTWTVVRARERVGPGAVERLVMLALWGIGAPLVAFAASHAVSVVLPRYLLFASLGLWLLLAYLVSLTPVRGWRRALLIALALGPTLVNANEPAIPRPDWQGALAIAREHHVPQVAQVVVSPVWEAITVAYYLVEPPHIALDDSLMRDLGFAGVRVAQDPDEVIADLGEQIRTVIVITGDASEDVAMLAMPQLCLFRERFTTGVAQLRVRVLDRDCTFE